MHSLLNVLLNFAYCDKKIQRIRVLKYYEDYYVDDDGVIEWHAGESHQKPKAQKASIKKDLMPTAWHPSRWWDWCMTGDEKKEIMVINMKHFVPDDRKQNNLGNFKSINKHGKLDRNNS